MKRHELTEEQWNKVKGPLPPERVAHSGRPGKGNWAMLNGILHWLNTGIPWRDLPERYDPWKSVHTRFRRWFLQGVWEHVFADKGYDSDRFVHWQEERGAIVVISSRKTSKYLCDIVTLIGTFTWNAI